jgi:peptide/nickel transport system permease protein
MLTMTLKRLAMAIPSLIGVVIVTFLLTRALPGDPAAYFAGPAATPQAIQEVRVKLGLDKPLIVQFGHYVVDLVHGNLGTSLTTGQPVATEIHNRLPACRSASSPPPSPIRSSIIPAASSRPPACRCRCSSPA